MLLGATVFVSYAVAAQLGLLFRVEPEKFAVFWPPNGLLLGLLLVANRQDRRLIVLVAAVASLVTNAVQGDPPGVCLGFAAVNTAEPFLTAWAWRRWHPGPHVITGARDVFLLYGLALGVCAATAVPGAAAVVLGLGAADYPAVWLAFWMSDAMAVMIVTPAVVAWAAPQGGPDPALSARRAAEGAALAGGLCAVALANVFRPAVPRPYLLALMLPVFPLLLWAALRFGVRGTTSVLLLVGLVVVWNAGHERGLFFDPAVPTAHRLLLAQFFISMVGLSKLALGAETEARRRALGALRESEERYREVTETIEEAFWVVHPDLSRVVYVSRAYESIWGRTRASLYADPLSFWDGTHPDDRDQVTAAVPALADGVFDQEYRVVRPDGTARWVHSRAFPLRDDRGVVRRVIGVSQDVTARREAEAANAALIHDLRKTLAEVKALRGLVPICAWCKKIRDDAGYWRRLEEYLRAHTEWTLTHGMCPGCLEAQLRDLEGTGPDGGGRRPAR